MGNYSNSRILSRSNFINFKCKHDKATHRTQQEMLRRYAEEGVSETFFACGISSLPIVIVNHRQEEN